MRRQCEPVPEAVNIIMEELQGVKLFMKQKYVCYIEQL